MAVAPAAPAITIVMSSMPPPIAAKVAAAVAAVVTKAKVHLDRGPVIAVTATVSIIGIVIVAGIGRPIHGTSPQPGSKQ
jgi:hypothetical protein